MTSQDQCREAFEAHYCPDASAKERARVFRLRPDGRYFNGYIQARYEGWQAARSAPSAPVEMPDPVAWLIERSAFRVSPHGQDAESNEWLEEAHEPGEEGSFRVYTEQQVRELLASAHEARREAQRQLEPYKTEITKLERYQFMLNRGALVPAGWVAVPVKLTDAMLEVVHEVAYDVRALAWREAETARYAALLAAAPKLPQGDGWLPIESAPRDGSWLALWRPPESEGSIMRSEPLIIARWSDEYGEFAWPDAPCDRFTPWGRAIADAIVEDGRRIFATNDFTHWMPLPQPPKEQCS